MTCRSVKFSPHSNSVRHLAYCLSLHRWAAILVVFLWATPAAEAKAPAPSCPAGVHPTASTPLKEKAAEEGCSPKTSRGFPIPDSACTPGAINPTVTLKVLQGGKFKTGCERDKATTRTKKNTTYVQYSLDRPKNNTGKKQTCELDHLVSLELGGADTLDNIWPQCGPDDVGLAQRFFKIKDSVENYLAVQVRVGAIALSDAQHGIAEDWTQYVDAATAYWSNHVARGFGRDE